MAMRVGTRVVDGDGHIVEDTAAIAAHLPAAYRNILSARPDSIFPPLDHLHSARAVETPPTRDRRPPVGPEGWIAFLDDVVDELGSRREVEGLNWILQNGSGADRQLRVYEATGGDLKKVVDYICEETSHGLDLQTP
jgi:hypothetical protein